MQLYAMANRLDKSEILRYRKDFNHIFINGQIMSSTYITIRYCPSQKRRVAFLVSNQVSKKAVRRNRIKRYLREIYRTHKDHFLDNYDYVFIAQPKAVELNFLTMRNEVLSLTDQIKKQVLN